MNEENKQIVIMECSGSYFLSDIGGQEIEKEMFRSGFKRPKFEELTKEEQELFFKIDSYADAEVNNYKSVKYPEWQGYLQELWPKEIIPQPIPGSKVFAKFTRVKGYSEAEVEFYNPTSEAQNLILLKSNPGSDSAKHFNKYRQRINFCWGGAVNIRG